MYNSILNLKKKNDNDYKMLKLWKTIGTHYKLKLQLVET